jgi:hypothetical protein
MILFARLEKLDLNASIPSNGVQDGTLNQSHVILGIAYLPIPDVTLKADVRLSHTGGPNPALLPPGIPGTSGAANDTFLNLGIGFSF